jgi:hypothetical protein
VTNLFHYSLHHRVLACDHELGFLRAAAATTSPDIVLRICSKIDAPKNVRSWYRSDASIVIDKTDDDDLVMRFEDGTEFLIDASGRSIALLSAPAAYTHDDVAAYALGPVIAVALHLQGAVLLHASAVVMNDKAVLFAGPTGSGKSTIAAILHRQGYAVLSDDVTEIASEGAVASQPAIRLWPDVLEALYGTANTFPDRAPSWDEKIVPLADGDAGGTHPIAAILFLEGNERTPAPRIERLTPADGWRRLIGNAYTARLPDPRMVQRIFEMTSALADRVPLYSFTPPALAVSGGLGSFL